VPQAPAFMANAPPKVPGIPPKNSAPVKPARAAKRATLAELTPASTYSVVSSNDLISFSKPAVSITAPRIPPSRTRMLLPKPSQKTGLCAGTCNMNCAKSAISAGA